MNDRRSCDAGAPSPVAASSRVRRPTIRRLPCSPRPAAPCSRISASIFTSSNRPRARTMPAPWSLRARRIGIEAGDDAVDVGFDVDAGLVLELAAGRFPCIGGAAELLPQLRGHDFVDVGVGDDGGVARDDTASSSGPPRAEKGAGRETRRNTRPARCRGRRRAPEAKQSRNTGSLSSWTAPQSLIRTDAVTPSIVQAHTPAARPPARQPERQPRR